jgi:uncharacterized damage-inducible protein DinB
MTAAELIILNSEEVRRRSIKLMQDIPHEVIHWKPDEEAMSIIEMVRHMLESEYIYNAIVNGRGNLAEGFISPWEERPYTSIADEIAFSVPYHHQFLESAQLFGKGTGRNRDCTRRKESKEKAGRLPAAHCLP